MKRLSRRQFLEAGAGGVALAAHPFDAFTQPSARGVTLNDASRLNPTRMHRRQTVAGDNDGLIEQLRAILKEAAADGRPVCMAGARHSMGGQSLVTDGIAAALTTEPCVPDVGAARYRVRAGAHWSDVIRVLDPLGYSVAVMQSNNDFSVGGTLSVNAHGWPVPFGPAGTTVRSLRLMLASGEVVTCSPTENAELFQLVIGGYGLFGIIIDAELDMTRNLLLQPRYETLDSEDFAEEFLKAVRDPATRMAYGRLSMARDQFLEEALLVSYVQAARQPAKLPPPASSGVVEKVSRELFRAQIGSEVAKHARWFAETHLNAIALRPTTRNSLLNGPVSDLADTNTRRTDILHEYFVPPERLDDFLKACRTTIPAGKQELLNVTLRYLAADGVSTLVFAPQPRIAAVMLFVYPATREADEAMRRMTERLIDQVLSLGGSFYLPYRLHARRDQVRAAYPRTEEFIAAKRRYDPDLRFRNLMWDKYFA
jgi:FAD/FMN-containing dehydrogenase